MKQFMLGTTAICAILSHSVPLYAESSVSHLTIEADSDGTGDGNINFYSSQSNVALLNDDIFRVYEYTDLDAGLNVDGNTTLDALSASGAVDLNSTLNVDGSTDLNSTLNVDGVSTFNDRIYVTDGSMDDFVGEDGFDTGDRAFTSYGGTREWDVGANLGEDGSEVFILDKGLIGEDGQPDREAQFHLEIFNPNNQDEDFMAGNQEILVTNGSVVLQGQNLNPSSSDYLKMGSIAIDDDVDLVSDDNIRLNAFDDIEMRAIEDFELVVGALGEDAESNPSNFPYSDHGGIIAIQGDHASRYIADDNGKIVLLDSETEWSMSLGEDTANSARNIAAGMSAQVLVKDVDGNARGLVVQENKTTLSGGQNAASLSLDENGATFSDPKNGKPIQVHGVADGTAPFDAVNVRQLYSGLAAVLAAGTPELRLEPGKTSAAVGVGYYGGYSGVGLGLGHMYDNGTVVSMSVGKATDSEVAVKGSVSWTW
jgi:hypothetical protein